MGSWSQLLSRYVNLAALKFCFIPNNGFQIFLDRWTSVNSLFVNFRVGTEDFKSMFKTVTNFIFVKKKINVKISFTNI